jgi:hypothetical protein
MKKSYKKPQIKTEEIKVGVYGDYGSSGSGGATTPLYYGEPVFMSPCCRA